jgi:drug/metabolite transporter (DMT)-like permease
VEQRTSLPDTLTLLAFTGTVLVGGMNFVAVRLWNREIPLPLFGPGVRFGAAALILFAVMRVRRIPFPRGSTLFGTVVYGLLNFAVFYALAYWALVELPAGVGAVVLAATPLITLLLVPLHGLESFRMRGLVGALIAMVGIALLANAPADVAVPLLPLLAMLGAALAAAESTIVIKRFPPTHPVATNAMAMGIAAVVLLVASALSGESWVMPRQGTTWLAWGYVVVIGSVGLFGLFLFTLSRWTASAVTFSVALMPVVAMVGGAVVAGEPITLNGVMGGVVVIVGVYVGALSRPRARVTVPPAGC